MPAPVARPGAVGAVSPPPDRKAPLAVRSLATWCFRHRRAVLLFWIVALVAVSFISKAVGTDYSNSFSRPNTESTRALDLSQSINPRQAGDTERIVFETTDGSKVTDPAVASRVTAMLNRVAALPNITDTLSPYSPSGAFQVSAADATIAYATVQFDIQGQNVSTKQKPRRSGTRRRRRMPMV